MPRVNSGRRCEWARRRTSLLVLLIATACTRESPRAPAAVNLEVPAW